VYARSTTFHGRPDNIDAGITFIKNEAGPMLDRIEVCRGLSLLGGNRAKARHSAAYTRRTPGGQHCRRRTRGPYGGRHRAGRADGVCTLGFLSRSAPSA
jgi:hypothetical protein